MKRVLCWGMGVQSTTLVAMSAKGLLPKLDVAIFSDLKQERQRTYEIGYWYSNWLKRSGLDVQIIDGGDVRVLGIGEHTHIPFWTSGGGPLRRKCTRELKIRPIRRRIREIMGFHSSKAPHPLPHSVELWIGMSYDELHRMSPSDVHFTEHRWPLVEKKMTRDDCIRWLNDNGLPVPVKSACIFCPFRSRDEYLAMRNEAPSEFESAIEFDESIRHNPIGLTGGSTSRQLFVWRGSNGIPRPLVDIDQPRAPSACRERPCGHHAGGCPTTD